VSVGPLVSVIMAAYNGEALIGESIDTVLAQTYEPIELVVVDDCSTDGTADVVEAYAKHHPDRIRLERKSSREGPCRRRNDALDLARGELIAWLDQDDLWFPEKTERQVEALLARPEVGLVYSGYEAFDSESGDTLVWRERETEAEGDVLIPLFVRGCFIASLTAVFRREVLTRRRMRLRETDFSFGDDYYLWLALSLDWQVALVDEVLARYRRHGQNESIRLGGTNFHQRRIELLREFVADFPEAKQRLGPWRRRGLARHYVRAANFEAASSRLRAAVPLVRALALAPGDTLRAVRGTDGHS
jgi:glycosyltransferase involved in cell wall biosynthesis